MDSDPTGPAIPPEVTSFYPAASIPTSRTRFGVADLDRFMPQTYLNELAPNFSKSVLAKTRVHFSSILGEAVELEFLLKDPAAKLVAPRSGKKAANQPLTPEQIPQVLFHLGDRDRLIVRMFLVLGLRPGEMFALRWDDKQGNSLRIDTAIVDGIEVETKTERSRAPDAQAHVLDLHGPVDDGKRCAGTLAPQFVQDDPGTLHQIRAGECARWGRIARPSLEESTRGFRTACELNPIESDFAAEWSLSN
jgi:hypothetical protein